MSVSSSPDAALPSNPPRRGPWLFWGTTLWALAIAAAMMIASVLAALAGFIWLAPPLDLTAEEAAALLYSRTEITVGILAAGMIAGLAVAALAVRLSRLSARDYLGLVAPRRREFVFGLAGLLGLYAIYAAVQHFGGAPTVHPWLRNLFQPSPSTADVVMLVVGIVIVAPVAEELLVRGFLQRGWSASRLGAIGAIVLTAALWASMHTQYGVTDIVYIFGIGLLFGWLRERSGSTVLTMLLHGIQNTASVVLTVIYFGLFTAS